MLSHYGCMCAGLPRVSQRTMTHLNKLAGEVSHHTLVWNNAFDWSERKKSPVKCMNRFKLFKCLQCCSVCNYSYIGICLACLRKWRSNGWHQNLNINFKMFQCRNNYSLFVKLDCMIWSSKTKFQLGGNWLLEIEEVSKRVRTCQLSVLTDSVGCSGAWSQLKAFDDSPGGGWHERQGALALAWPSYGFHERSIGQRVRAGRANITITVARFPRPKLSFIMGRQLNAEFLIETQRQTIVPVCARKHRQHDSALLPKCSFCRGLRKITRYYTPGGLQSRMCLTACLLRAALLPLSKGAYDGASCLLTHGPGSSVIRMEVGSWRAGNSLNWSLCETKSPAKAVVWCVAWIQLPSRALTVVRFVHELPSLTFGVFKSSDLALYLSCDLARIRFLFWHMWADTFYLKWFEPKRVKPYIIGFY